MGARAPVKKVFNELAPAKKNFNELYLYPKGRRTRMQITMDIAFGRKKDGFFRVYPDVEMRTAERPPRVLDQTPDQDWTSVWPTAQSFRSSVVPLTMSMGHVKDARKKASPGAYGNLQLMKIPNFLHLTPKHIQKHCEAIKKFCTKFPDELKNEANREKYFPVQVQYSDYVHQGTNIRDMRARVVQMQVRLNALEFDTHGHNKFRQLVGDRYNEQTGVFTISSESCPIRKQNRDYCTYLLTALYYESKKVEPWESNFAQELLATKEAERQHREHSDLISTGHLMSDEEIAAAAQSEAEN